MWTKVFLLRNLPHYLLKSSLFHSLSLRMQQSKRNIFQDRRTATRFLDRLVSRGSYQLSHLNEPWVSEIRDAIVGTSRRGEHATSSSLLYFAYLPCQVDLNLTAVKWDWIDLMGAVKVISLPSLIVEGRAFIFRSNSMHSRISVCMYMIYVCMYVCDICMYVWMYDVCVMCVRACVYVPADFFISYVFPQKRFSTLVGERWTGLSRARLIFVVAVASSRKLPGTNAKSMLIRGGTFRNLRNREPQINRRV